MLLQESSSSYSRTDFQCHLHLKLYNLILFSLNKPAP